VAEAVAPPEVDVVLQEAVVVPQEEVAVAPSQVSEEVRRSSLYVYPASVDQPGSLAGQ
jgi:hypothetical protein